MEIAHKEYKNTICIYSLNFPDGSVYYGSAKSMYHRLHTHINRAKYGEIPLYKKWREFGAPIVCVIQKFKEFDKKFIRTIEAELTKIAKSKLGSKVLNIQDGNEKNDVKLRKKRSAETKAKISARNKDRILSAKTKAKMSAAHKGKKKSPVWEHEADIKAEREAGASYYSMAKKYKTTPITIKRICVS